MSPTSCAQLFGRATNWFHNSPALKLATASIQDWWDRIISCFQSINIFSFQVCDGVDDCPMGEDENSEDWFSSVEVFTGSFSKDFVHEQLRLWGEHYLKSNNASGTIEEKMSPLCVTTNTKIFLLYTILVCTVVALVILLPAVCLVGLFAFSIFSSWSKFIPGSQKEGPNNHAQITRQ